MQALLSIVSLALAAQGALASIVPSVHEARAAATLNEVMTSHGKKYWGNIADPGLLLDTPENVAILKEQFGQLTPENSLKWDSTEPNSGNFTHKAADEFFDFAKANDKLVRGSYLLWHSQLPTYVKQIQDKDAMTTAIQDHIIGVGARYKGYVYAWDVVNEVFNSDGSLRYTPFRNVLDEDYITIAFKTIKAVDPSAKRYISDYGLDSVNAKLNGLVALVNRINSAEPGLIQGIGSQGHLLAGQGADALAALTALAAADVDEVAITELDIAGAAPEDYVAVAKACIAVKKCVGITSYGVSDYFGWRSEPEEGADLWDENFRPKRAVKALLAL